MKIVISILVYALIAFLMYLMLDGEKKIAAFGVNIIGLFVYYCITNGFNHIFTCIISSIINGILFGFIGSYMYNKFDSLNKFLGTTVLVELIVVLITNGILAFIMKMLYIIK